jgi:hypothetical protein
MPTSKKRVDGFRFLPPGLAAWIRTRIPEQDFSGHIPWTPLSKPLSKATIALVTSAGINLKTDPPFDMEREKIEPECGDPSYRRIPRETTAAAIEYPYGRPVGEVGDVAGQRRVLQAALTFLAEVRKPGEIRHLPFTWHEHPKETHWHPPHMSPIVKAYLHEIKQARNRSRAG